MAAKKVKKVVEADSSALVVLRKMEQDASHAYSISLKAGKCIIERHGSYPCMVIEDTLDDALVVVGSLLP